MLSPFGCVRVLGANGVLRSNDHLVRVFWNCGTSCCGSRGSSLLQCVWGGCGVVVVRVVELCADVGLTVCDRCGWLCRWAILLFVVLCRFRRLPNDFVAAHAN